MNIRENVGMLDTAIRSVLAIALYVLASEGIVTGAMAWGATIVGTVMLLTASFGNCPLYKIIGVNTWGKVKHNLIEH